MAELKEIDTFKESFKFFKKLSVDDLRARAVDLGSGNVDKHTNEVIELGVPRSASSYCEAAVTKTEEARLLGLRPPQEWRVYTLKRVPGLQVIPNPFLSCGQHHWVKRCLEDYPVKPNVCNLDAHMTRPGNGRLWPLTPTTDELSIKHSSVEHQKSKCSNLEDNPKVLSGNQSTVNTIDKDKSHSLPKDQHLVKCVGSECFSVSDKPPSKRIKLSGQVPLPTWLSRDSMLYKLRWVTLGYHYNWSSKEYSPHHRSTFPQELGQLSSYVLDAVGFPEFKAEAAIVNYYHLDSTLSGHTDHSEKDLSFPLLSISLGQSALFLIGGQTKEVSPVPLLLNSGDIVIMSGPSRLAYHGVPRVLTPSPAHTIPYSLHKEHLENCVCTSTEAGTKCGSELTTDKVSGDKDITRGTGSRQCLKYSDRCLTCSVCCQLANSWDVFVDYLLVSRININVRQVVSGNFEFGT